MGADCHTGWYGDWPGSSQEVGRPLCLTQEQSRGRKPTELKDFTTKGMTLVESFEFRELVFDLFHSKMTWKATVEYEIRGVKLIYGAFG